MKPGRNDPCTCGSGKKYKKCCLSLTYTAKGKEDSIRERLVQDLLDFFRINCDDSFDDAYHEFWEDFNPEEQLSEFTLPMGDINFWEWIVHDYLIYDENEKSLIDLFIERSKKLSLDEHRVLTMMKHSIISLYEVQEVFPGKGLILKDLLLGGEYDVSEKAATEGLRKWDVYATRLMRIDGQYIMSGSVYPYRLNKKEDILWDIRSEFDDYRIDYPDAALDEFLKENSWLFNFYWYDNIQNPMGAVKELKKPNEKHEDELPIEVRQQFYNEFMNKHYEKWMTDKIPALDGKTPVQAVKTKSGREKVAELLKSIENEEEHKKRKGEPFYDLSWMWDKLGLDREA